MQYFYDFRMVEFKIFGQHAQSHRRMGFDSVDDSDMVDFPRASGPFFVFNIHFVASELRVPQLSCRFRHSSIPFGSVGSMASFVLWPSSNSNFSSSRIMPLFFSILLKKSEILYKNDSSKNNWENCIQIFSFATENFWFLIRVLKLSFQPNSYSYRKRMKNLFSS